MERHCRAKHIGFLSSKQPHLSQASGLGGVRAGPPNPCNFLRVEDKFSFEFHWVSLRSDYGKRPNRLARQAARPVAHARGPR
jgi:hypothetical protein